LLCIGLMSGTSVDGVDAVLAELADGPPRVVGATYLAFPPDVRAALLGLQGADGDELHRAALAANALVDVYAEAVRRLLAETKTEAAAITAIGAHGQTVRHRPADGYTLQINNPARLAEATGITVVADFRSRDVAAGGQGAPLVPAFHAAVFQEERAHRAVVNIGGIANVTNLPPGSGGRGVTGWDTGPGNVLLDGWCERHRGQSYDDDGRWGAAGRVDDALLARLRAEPYFGLLPPKSTGRDLFNPEWLDRALAHVEPRPPADVQATLLRLTADTIAADVLRFAAGATELIVCGGGARNGALMARLQQALGRDAAGAGAPVPVVRRSDDAGLASNHIEALAFAWLARAALERRPGNLPAVTGARGLRVLGAIYPA
jgi:anhydro-N-acetylmuramic acid kinase